MGFSVGHVHLIEFFMICTYKAVVYITLVNLKCLVSKDGRERSGSVLDSSLRVRASLASLRCGP